MDDKERRISLAEEFVQRLEGIKDDLREGLNIIVIDEKIDCYIEHFNEYISKQKSGDNNGN